MTWQGRAGALALLACAVAAVVALAPAGAAAGLSSRQVRLGAAPVFPAGSSLLAGVASVVPMRVTLALAPRAPAALIAYADAVVNPSSVAFHHYLTPVQFRQRFAPSSATVAAVSASLRRHGLRPGRASINGLSIPVRTNAEAVSHAFSLSFVRIELRGGAEAMVNTQAPALDSGIAGAVQSVIGLNSLDHPVPTLARLDHAKHIDPAAAGLRAHVATGGPQPCSAARAAAPTQDAYTADQIASAYAFSGLYHAGDEGAGQTIGLYELEPDSAGDLAAFQSCYRTHTSITYSKVDGGAGSGPGSGEAALDIEQVIGLAPRAHILVYQAPNSNLDAPGSGPYDLDSAIVSQDLASVISSSWGQCEPTEGVSDAAAENTLFEEAAVQGQTMVSAAGDNGAEDCDAGGSNPNLQATVDDPSSQPYVTGVGGTSLTSLGPPPTETAWNNGSTLTGLLTSAPGAGGGGVSSLWPMPVYQSAAPSSLNVKQNVSSGTPCHDGTGDCREVPDVSADADPETGYLYYYNGDGTNRSYPSGWQGTGGTSGAAPLWGALMTLTNAEKVCQGSTVGFVNPALYRLAAGSEKSYFNDVTSGNNDFTGTNQGRYAAGVGYDMATGLGSPKASALAAALCTQGLRLAAPAALYSFRRIAIVQRLKGSDAAGAGLRYSASGLPKGLGLDTTTGVIAGRPQKLGSFRVTVSASDASGAARVVHFTWTIDTPPRVSGVNLTGVAVGAPALILTIRAGRDEPALRAVVVVLPVGLRLRSKHPRVSVRNSHGATLPHTTSVSHGRLTIRLRSADDSVRLGLAAGTLTADSPLIGAAVRRHARTLEGQLAATDRSGQSAALTLTLRVKS